MTGGRAPSRSPWPRRPLPHEQHESDPLVDAQRGRTVGEDVPLQPEESRGTDLAESISEIVLRVRIEVNGPQGRE